MTDAHAPSTTAERAAFARRLRALRRSYGVSIGEPKLTQEAFASKLGLLGQTYRRYERAETEPPLRVLTVLRRLTGVSLDQLVTGEIGAS